VLKGSRNDGFTLVEAMVALALMLAGIAGAAMLLLQSVQYERESATRRNAIRLAGSLAEELRARRPADGRPLAPDADLILGWSATARAQLPAAAVTRVEVLASEPAAYQITIEWPASGIGTQHLRLAVTT
jgi:prepilin-type N-terminal cleavage/methylation domain-containing protein